MLDNDTPRPASAGPLFVNDVFDPLGPLPIAIEEKVQKLTVDAGVKPDEKSSEGIVRKLGKKNDDESRRNATKDSDAGGPIAEVRKEVPSLQGGLCAITGNRQRVRYTPPAGFVGRDFCIYEACDQRGACGAGVVTLDVALGFPTLVPTLSPSQSPTTSPTLSPSVLPTDLPTFVP